MIGAGIGVPADRKCSVPCLSHSASWSAVSLTARYSISSRARSLTSLIFLDRAAWAGASGS